ncbi:MAG TPA: DUF6084 family protein [Candidatus Dormibacteraeota bacterium]|jgi:hypothetical protein|nr:DUF6084 family protein [Candidatus Dormibacteraeota bacterium]
MPDLEFAVDSVAVVEGSMTPILAFGLRVSEMDGGDVDSVVLSCQIMVDAVRRPYAAREQEALLDIFGAPSRWGTTLKTMLWTHAGMTVPAFAGETIVTLPVPATFDLSLAPAKYFFALEDGDVPLTFQFSGTVFYRDREGFLAIDRIAWTKEARFRLPVSVWRELVAQHDHDGAWLCLGRDVFDRLYRYKAQRGVATWEEVVDSLLESSAAAATT